MQKKTKYHETAKFITIINLLLKLAQAALQLIDCYLALLQDTNKLNAIHG